MPEIPQTPYIFYLDQLHKEMAASSGGKMANLGEMHNLLNLATPPGFVITAAAYQHFLHGSGLAKILEAKLQEADITNLIRLEAVSQELQDLVRQATLPGGFGAGDHRGRRDFRGGLYFGALQRRGRGYGAFFCRAVCHPAECCPG